MNIEKKPAGVSLRQATNEDLDFLYAVSTEAMRSVREKITPEQTRSGDEVRAEYRNKFDPEKIQVIQFDGKDVGRLRVVRTPESIYVGGIQLLPEFQGRGIGTKLFTDLIRESESTKRLITLEVHEVNEQAKHFYVGLGFAEGERKEGQVVLTYTPKGI